MGNGWRAARVQLGLLLSACMVFAAACTPPEPSPPRGGQPAGLPPYTGDQGEWINAPHMTGNAPVRVGLLLPLSAPQPEIREVAEAIHSAAEMALFAQRNDQILLVTKDTKGSSLGASEAANAAIREGVEVILGPLVSPSVSAVSQVARMANVPVVAFSTDQTVAVSNSVFLLSFMIESELEAIARQATSEGITQFAMMVPQGPYGQRVAETFPGILAKYGGSVVHSETYARDTSAMFEPAQRLASAASLSPYQAVLIPEGGNLLRSLAPALAYYGVDPREVRFFGTGLWNDPSIQREPSLRGGQFPAPPPEERANFIAQYRAVYGSAPPRIASLGYDAVLLAAYMANEGPRGVRYASGSFLNPNGFAGVDGIYRFRNDGVTERGFSILQITTNGFEVVRPAPLTFQAGPQSGAELGSGQTFTN